MPSTDFGFTWQDVPLLEVRPPAKLAEGDTFRVGDFRYWECGTTGHNMLIAWLLGPRTLRRYRDERVVAAAYTISDSGGVRSRRQEIDDDFANEIEEALNGYLLSAGLRGRPAGFRWFQTIPGQLEPQALSEAANRAEIRHRKSPNGLAAAVPAIQNALRILYRNSGQ